MRERSIVPALEELIISLSVIVEYIQYYFSA
jgi:hypothetical protein